MIQKFKDLFTSELEKSLTKAGFLKDKVATDDGVLAYVTWLIMKDDHFLNEVVNKIIDEENKNK